MNPSRFLRATAMALLWLVCGGCGRSAPAPEPLPAEKYAAPGPVARASAPVSASAAPSASAASPHAPAVPPLDLSAYAWLGDDGYDGPQPVDRLGERFSPPDGLVRVPVAKGSFGEWLRSLPLAAPGTPVKSYAGKLLYAADDERVAAVLAIDTGSADLQQCADAVVRLHAEWSWANGKREMSYRAASGLALPFQRFARGERVVAKGASLRWKPMGRPGSDHSTFRRYLDTVFAWANTVSIQRQASRVSPEALQAGDFFVLGGNPGHAVLVLDLACAADGRRVALIGQSYMPAQNLFVLRPHAGAVWFSLVPDRDVVTPFWRPFPWSSLRRLPE